MEIDKASFANFYNLYKQEYKIELTKKEVLEYSSRLIMFVKAVHGDNLPDNKEMIDIDNKN